MIWAGDQEWGTLRNMRIAKIQITAHAQSDLNPRYSLMDSHYEIESGGE